MKVNIILKYNDEYFKFDFKFPTGYPFESADFMFSEGNFSCDCNKSVFIHEHYPDFPILSCGEDIELILIEEKKSRKSKIKRRGRIR